MGFFSSELISRDIRQNVMKYYIHRMGTKLYFLSKVCLVVILVSFIVSLSNFTVISLLSLRYPLVTQSVEGNENILKGLSNGYFINYFHPSIFYGWLIIKQCAEMICITSITLVVSFFCNDHLFLYITPIMFNVCTIFLDNVSQLPIIVDYRRVFSMYNYMDNVFGIENLENRNFFSVIYPIFYLISFLFLIYVGCLFFYRRNIWRKKI